MFEGHWRDKLSECHPRLVFAKPGVERQDSVLSGLQVSWAHSQAFSSTKPHRTAVLPSCPRCDLVHLSLPGRVLHSPIVAQSYLVPAGLVCAAGKLNLAGSLPIPVPMPAENGSSMLLAGHTGSQMRAWQASKLRECQGAGKLHRQRSGGHPRLCEAAGVGSRHQAVSAGCSPGQRCSGCCCCRSAVPSAALVGRC